MGCLLGAGTLKLICAKKYDPTINNVPNPKFGSLIKYDDIKKVDYLGFVKLLAEGILQR